MKVIDIIFALIAGKIISFLIGDVLKELGISIGLYYFLILWVAFPIIALICLWLASIIGRKLLFVYQGAKHLLVGAVATVADLKFFESLIWLVSLAITINPILAKAASFLFSTAIKYWGNKYWAFGKPEKENWRKELFHFILITLVGLLLDVGIFYYFTMALGPQFALSAVLWTKVSVVMAAVIAALWNFLGYKFLVFKK
jgi:putative flippase GtrA